MRPGSPGRPESPLGPLAPAAPVAPRLPTAPYRGETNPQPAPMRGSNNGKKNISSKETKAAAEGEGSLPSHQLCHQLQGDHEIQEHPMKEKKTQISGQKRRESFSQQAKARLATAKDLQRNAWHL